MKIELKKIDLCKSLSEETPAYTAQVWVDGKHFCDVSNHGHGGCDMQHGPKGMTNNDFDPLLRQLEEKIKAEFPKSSYTANGETHYFDASLEGICHEQVWDADLVKTIKRDLAGKVMFIKTDGKLYQVKSKGAEQSKMIEIIKAKADVKTILNTLTIDEAVAIYKAQ